MFDWNATSEYSIPYFSDLNPRVCQSQGSLSDRQTNVSFSWQADRKCHVTPLSPQHSDLPIPSPHALNPTPLPWINILAWVSGRLGRGQQHNLTKLPVCWGLPTVSFTQRKMLASFALPSSLSFLTAAHLLLGLWWPDSDGNKQNLIVIWKPPVCLISTGFVLRHSAAVQSTAWMFPLCSQLLHPSVPPPQCFGSSFASCSFVPHSYHGCLSGLRQGWSCCLGVTGAIETQSDHWQTERKRVLEPWCWLSGMCCPCPAQKKNHPAFYQMTPPTNPPPNLRPSPILVMTQVHRPSCSSRIAPLSPWRMCLSDSHCFVCVREKNFVEIKEVEQIEMAL